jgi:molecular chaperone GrpE
MADDRTTEASAATDPDAAAEQPADRDSSASRGDAADLATLKRERDDYYDRLLRKTAEFDNYRKRVERERREQADEKVTNLLIDLLAVVDDFELALEADAGEDASAYQRGIELIHAKLQDLLKRHGVRPIQALGTDFDPNRHQAVMHETSPDHREGEVIGELRRGYTIGDRLLRPAMVKVAKA